MRFLILTQYYAPEIGAAAVRLGATARELTRLGHEVEVVTAMPNYPEGTIQPGYHSRLYCRESLDGVVVHRTWLRAAAGSGAPRLACYGTFAASSLVGLARAHKPDWIFVNSGPLFLMLPAYLAARRWRVPLILNVADLWPDSVRDLGVMREGPLLRLARRLEAWSYGKARYVTAVTEGIRAALIQEKDVPARKVLFLPNGVDTDLFRPRPPDADMAREVGLADRKVLLYAGTLGLAHSVQTALHAAEALKRRHPDALLAIVGSGSDGSRLRKWARVRELDNVLFLEPAPQETIARLYSLAVAGVVTLRNSPLSDGVRPAKLLQIMAAGKPVLYSGAGEGARLVAEANAGLVTPPEDGAALAASMDQVLNEPERAAEWGRRGRAYLSDSHSWQTIVGNWLSDLTERRVESHQGQDAPPLADAVATPDTL